MNETQMYYLQVEAVVLLRTAEIKIKYIERSVNKAIAI